MLVREEWPIRGFRPGRYGLPEEETEEDQILRMANVEIYAERVRAGLPIFRDAGDSAVGGDKAASAT
ncbi:MAG: hypothetical protein SVV80_03035 [Planctomycetota bacterium]|nr:hypothetical protein [Planctomycetota bacterium]